MNHFDYREGVLHAEDVPLPEIAVAVGTPFYVYSTATLTRRSGPPSVVLIWSRLDGENRKQGSMASLPTAAPGRAL